MVDDIVPVRKSDALVKRALTRGVGLSPFPLNLTPESTSLTNATHRCVFDPSSTKSHYTEQTFRGRRVTASPVPNSGGYFPISETILCAGCEWARLCRRIVSPVRLPALLQHWQVITEPMLSAGAGRMTSETDCCRLERRRKKEREKKEKKSRAAVALQRKLEV